MKFPAAVLQQHLAVLGKTGSGKTSTGKLAIEQVVHEGARVCVLDPIKSDWWGLISSADGKRPGLPFHILGGPRGHVPLHDKAGKAIGELVSSGALPLSILDMIDFPAGGLQHFFVDFASTLIRRMRGVLYLVIEEAHEFAPKERTGVGQENLSIHWAKKLATAGRSKGIRLILLSQRTQALHNALLGSCDTLIAHRFTTPADQDPVNKWLKANVKPDVAREVAESLSSLKTGEAWICAGEAKIFERKQFPRIKTYDNSATPTDDSHDQDVKTAPVDAEKLRAILGEAVKEADANDPRRLREQLAAAQRELANLRKSASPGQGAAPAELAAEYSRGRSDGFDAGRAKGREELLDRLAELHGPIATASNAITAAVERLRKIDDLPPIPVSAVQNRREPAPRARLKASGGPGEALPRAERQLLIVLAQRWPKDASRAQLSILSGYSITSSSFANALGALRAKGYCEGYGDNNHITEEGSAALGDYEPMPTGRQLVTWWLGRLPKAERAMLEHIAGRYPHTVSKEELAGETGYSITSSSFANALGKLRSLELIERGDIKASEELFDG